MKTLVILEKGNSLNNALSYMKENSLIICLDEEMENELKSKDIKFKKLDEYEKNGLIYKNLDKEALSWARSWHKNIKKLTEYNRIYLIELLKLDYLFSDIFRYIRLLKVIIEKEKPDKIIMQRNDKVSVNHFLVEDNDNTAFEICKEIIKNKNISLDIFKYKPLAKKFNLKLYYKEKLSILLAKIQNNFYKLKILPLNDKKVLVVGGLGQFSSLINKLNEQKNFSVIRCGENVGLGFRKGQGYYLTFKYYSTFRIKRILKTYKKILNKNYEKIIDDNKIKNEFFYKDINFYNVLEKKLDYFFNKQFLKLIKYIEIMNDLAKDGIKIILTPNDVVMFEKTLTIAARKNKVKSLTIQIGASGHPVAYIPLSSDYMGAWGKVTRDWMIKYGTEKSKVVITGAPRLDYYINKNSMSREEFFKSINVDPNKKIIVYTPQFSIRHMNFANWHFTFSERASFLRNTFLASKKIDNSFVIVKMHPSDFDYNLPNEIAKSMNFKNYLVTKNVDLFELLSNCDVLITVQSTTGLESMILKKPVIDIGIKKPSIDKSFFKDSIGYLYVKSGSALESKNNLNDLTRKINLLINNKKIQIKLRNNMEKLVYDYSYKQDGKATERVVDLIKKLI